MKKNSVLLSKIATITLFLALIRCLAEPFRLQYYADTILALPQLKPYLLGALVAAIGLLIITFLNYYNKHKFILIIWGTSIAAMVWLKFHYQIN